MQRVNLLIGSSDRRTSSIIEAGVRDVYYNLALIECFRTSRIDQFTRLACHTGFDLVFVAPNGLVPEPSRKLEMLSIEEVLGVIKRIKRSRIVPVFAVAVPPALEAAVLEAGADNVFGLSWDDDVMKAELRQVMRLPEPVEAGESEQRSHSRWSLLGGLTRGFM